jgi:hypothetical protein
MIIVNGLAIKLQKADIVDGVVTIPDGVTGVGYAFGNNSIVKKVIVPKSVKMVGYSFFCNCILLEEVVIPENLRFVVFSFVRGCPSLKTIKIY